MVLKCVKNPFFTHLDYKKSIKVVNSRWFYTVEYKLLPKLYYKDKIEYEETYNSRFNNENTFHFNIKIHENEAFCCITPEIFSLSNEISKLDKKIFELEKKLPQAAINQFAKKSLIDEIVQTNYIEGVHSTRKEINLILSEPVNNKIKRRFKGLVAKYQMLSKETIPLKTCEDIRKIYDELVLNEVTEDDPQNAPDGVLFRKEIAEVTTETQKVIHRGLYPEEKITNYMEQSLRILNDEEIPILIRISVFHYLFGYIHPFYDGNGRTSRFISSYLLSNNYEYLIGYRLSYTIKENLGNYYEAFRLSNDDKSRGDITPFVIMFLKIIFQSMSNLFEALYKRYENLNKYKQLLENRKEIDINVSYVLLQATLFSDIGMTKEELCEAVGICRSTLQHRLKVIDEKGYLITNKIGRENCYKLNIESL